MTAQTLFNQQATGAFVTSDTTEYTLGMQFTLSANAPLSGIWFYSATGANGLPVGCCIFQQTSPGAGSIVAGTSNTSPSWSGAAGSGWVRCAYPAGPTLTAGTVYKVAVLKDTTSMVYSDTVHYWDTTGAGASGITSGIITAPNNAGADGGQNAFASGVATLTYPAGSFGASNYWLDVEVQVQATGSGLLAASLP